MIFTMVKGSCGHYANDILIIEIFKKFKTTENNHMF